VQISSIASVVPYLFGAPYNASKVALNMYSDTLRLEIGPFGVRVLTAVIGGVGTMIVQPRDGKTTYSLPDSSLYKPIEDEVERRRTYSEAGATPAWKFAAFLVRETLKMKTKKTIWGGNRSGLVWFISVFIGRWYFDWIMPRMFGLKRLEGIIGKGAKRP
jgi:1-acylglycerone phosphate reductase